MTMILRAVKDSSCSYNGIDRVWFRRGSTYAVPDDQARQMILEGCAVEVVCELHAERPMLLVGTRVRLNPAPPIKDGLWARTIKKLKV